MPLMIHEMEAHALDRPRFRATADQVSVELHRHGAEVPRLREWLRSLTDRPLSSPEDAALIMARREGVVTVARLRDDLRIDSDDARALLQNLVNLGLLRAVGTEAYELWSGGSTLRRSELDVLDVLSIDHPRGISELAELLGKSPNTAPRTAPSGRAGRGHSDCASIQPLSRVSARRQGRTQALIAGYPIDASRATPSEAVPPRESKALAFSRVSGDDPLAV